MTEAAKERTPRHLSDGVKAGILASIQQDVEHRGSRTARLLAAAGLLGVVGAVGVTFLVSAHAMDHHPPWHIAVCGAAWTGILIVSLAISFLQLKTPTLPLSHAAGVGLLGLGLAGVCGAVCPDQEFLRWWSGTLIGSPVLAVGGPALSAMCFGIIVTLFVGTVSTLALVGRGRGAPIRPVSPALMLFLLLAPGVALQSVNASWTVFGAWLLGTGFGAYLGVAAGIRTRELLESRFV